MKEKIIIVGAGIGGLTTALALLQKGFDVDIYEAASEIKSVGAGIVMANNAMQVFEQLGVREQIEKAGCKISNIKITDESLHTIQSSSLITFEKKYGVYNVAIHRAALQTILADAIGRDKIHLGKRLLRIEKRTDYTLYFEDDTMVHAPILIGADGIKSVVRKQIFGSGEIRDTKQRCWRGLTEVVDMEQYHHDAYEAWGEGKRFGFVKVSANKVYWYAVVNDSMLQTESNIHTLFADFHPDIRKMINSTPEHQFIFSDIIDLKPLFEWQKDKVCLLGDAVHATTPNMGQGACQAVEDAYVLANLLAQEKTVEDAFVAYEKLRIKKAHFIVNSSWTLGKVAHYKNPLAVWLRNNVLKVMPQWMNEKQMDKVFKL
jgi:2-polyprenyl-6-methoxyphenol hydroxylase-like FAD-dependent oxidoreductase